MKETLRRFLAETVAPDDEIAFVTVGSPAGIVQPTRDRAALRQAIGRIRARQESIMTGQGAQLTPEQAEQILRGDPSALRLATRLVMEEPGSLLSGRLVPKNMSSDPVPAGLEPGEKGAGIEVERQARRVLAEALSISETSLWTLERVLRGLAPRTGRKICLFVSDGFPVGKDTSEERSQRLRRVIDAATRSGTAVYPLVVTGFAPIGGDAAAVGGAGPAGLRDHVARMAERQRLETLAGLADDTGGFVVRGADAVDTGLVRMLEDDASLYLLAYEPANHSRNGRFRRIAVRLPRHRDYVVRARKGYFARRAGSLDRDQPAPPWLPPSSAEAQLALAADPRLGGIPLHVAVNYVEMAPEGPQAVVKAYLDPAQLPWRKVEGRRKTVLDLVGGVYDAAGRPNGPPFAVQRYELDLGPAEYDALLATGVRFATRVPLKPGRYEVRMLALDAAQAPLGGARQPLEVPDLAQNGLTLSDIFLSSAAAGSGEPAPLRDAQALRHFEASETLVYHVFVYNAARDALGKGDVVLQAQLRSAVGQPYASKPRLALLREKDGVLLPEGNGIPLASVGPGRYELRIVAVDRKTAAAASRSIDFTIE